MRVVGEGAPGRVLLFALAAVATTVGPLTASPLPASGDRSGRGTAQVLARRAASEPAAAERQKPAPNPQAVVISKFNERVEQYLALRKKAAATVEKHEETSDPAAITAREKALAEGIRRLRRGAKPGDVFGADMARLVVGIVRKDWAARAAADRVALFEDLPKPFVPRVNMSWPSGYPFATFPASMLAQLQQLPDGLEYRFVGRNLVLRDVEANLIVDVIQHALPA